jgi:ATP-dependent Clp protease ATP-binding subunit ClpX
VITTVSSLDRSALIQILSKPKNALIKQYQKMFQLDGVELLFDDDALDSIADQALGRGTGARGLRAIMEEVLLPVMFDLPSRDDIASVVITADAVTKKGQPTMIAHEVVAKRRNKSA